MNFLRGLVNIGQSRLSLDPSLEEFNRIFSQPPPALPRPTRAEHTYGLSMAAEYRMAVHLDENSATMDPDVVSQLRDSSDRRTTHLLSHTPVEIIDLFRTREDRIFNSTQHHTRDPTEHTKITWRLIGSYYNMIEPVGGRRRKTKTAKRRKTKTAKRR